MDRMRGEAERAAPEECCGLLFGRGELIDEIHPAMNVAGERRRRFEIDPQALVDAHRTARRGGPQVLGYYHSHPAGPAEPSTTDRAMASGDGSVWAIVGAGDVTFWRDDGDGFAPLPYAVEDR
jgi:proteasome lid subunit RPN8/RPN11